MHFFSPLPNKPLDPSESLFPGQGRSNRVQSVPEEGSHGGRSQAALGFSRVPLIACIAIGGSAMRNAASAIPTRRDLSNSARGISLWELTSKEGMEK